MVGHPGVVVGHQGGAGKLGILQGSTIGARVVLSVQGAREALVPEGGAGSARIQKGSASVAFTRKPVWPLWPGT